MAVAPASSKHHSFCEIVLPPATFSPVPSGRSASRPHHWVNVKLGCGTVRVPPRQKPHFFGVLFGVLWLVAHRSSSHNGSKLAIVPSSAVGSGRLLPGHLTISAMFAPPGKAAKGTKVGKGLSRCVPIGRSSSGRDPLPLVSRPIGSFLSYSVPRSVWVAIRRLACHLRVTATSDGYKRAAAYWLSQADTRTGS